MPRRDARSARAKDEDDGATPRRKNLGTSENDEMQRTTRKRRERREKNDEKRTNGCENGCDTCFYAASNGHLECLLKYAHEHGCPWDELTCSFAAMHGHLECLKYAHEHGCPWNEYTCAYAAHTGHLGCLKYAQDHSAPESARYVVGWQRICACTTDLIVQIALSRQRDGYVSLRELTPAVNHFLRAWPELALPEDVIRRILFDADLKPMTPRARFSRMIALYATK